MGRRQLTAACLTLMFALAGCGGSSALSQEQLVASATAACNNAEGHLAALAKPSDLTGLAGYAGEVRASTSQLRQRLAALTPPQAERAALNRYLSALDEGDRILAQLSSAAASRDGAAVKALGTRLAAVNAGGLAVNAGLLACASAT